MSVGKVRDEAREAKFRKEVDKVFTVWHAPVFILQHRDRARIFYLSRHFNEIDSTL